jgi:hypothetical protein
VTPRRGERTQRSNREAFDLYADKLAAKGKIAAAATVRRVGKAKAGRGVEVAEDEHEIGLTCRADVLQPLIDAGDLVRVELHGEELEELNGEEFEE